MSGDGDGFTSADRNFLRVVERYGGTAVVRDVARGLGVSHQAVGAMAMLLENAGFLMRAFRKGSVTYVLTTLGTAYLEAHQATYLLVEVDDRAAGDFLAALGSVSGVLSVTAHNEDHPNGCCCQHCPHDGNCR